MTQEDAIKLGIEMPAYLDLWLLWQILQRLAPIYTLDGGIYLTSPFAFFLDAYKLAVPAMGATYSPKPEFKQLTNSSWRRTLEGEYLLEELNQLQPKPRTLRFPDDYDLSRLENLTEWLRLPMHSFQNLPESLVSPGLLRRWASPENLG